MTNARMLAPHMTDANCEDLLAAARHRSKRDVEEIRRSPEATAGRPQRGAEAAVAAHRAEAARRASRFSSACQHVTRSVRTAPDVSRSAGVPRPVVAPLAPERYKIQFTASREVHDKLRTRRTCSATSSQRGCRDGVRSCAVRSDRSAGEAEVRRHLTPAPAARRRARIPAHPGRREARGLAPRRRTLRVRGARGRCAERGFLEFHHVVPFAAGGAADAGTSSCAAAHTICMRRSCSSANLSMCESIRTNSTSGALPGTSTGSGRCHRFTTATAFRLKPEATHAGSGSPLPRVAAGPPPRGLARWGAQIETRRAWSDNSG